MERYDEWVNDAEHEAARQITGWWRQLDNPDEVARELITRIREEVPALVDPERFNAERRPLEILETILRDRRPEGGREAYTRLVRRIVEDARTGEQLPLRPWTAQVGDAMFRANTVVVEARTVSEACGLALEAANNNADGWKEGGEPSDSFIDAISPGRNVDPWESGWENVPNNYTQDHVMGDGDDAPGPGTPTAPPAKSPRTPPNDEGERAAAPATRDDPEHSARAADDGPEAGRVWSNGTTSIDLDLVRMLDQGRSHMPGKFHTVVVWHGATHTTAVELDDADRDSLHDAFAAYARQRPKR